MEGPNPLRPYYIPLPLGVTQDHYQNLSDASRIGSKYATNALASSSFGSSARNILADMDYSEYLLEPSSSPSAFIKNLFEQGLWKYTSIFLAQPFEVAKIVLQVHLANSKQKTLSAAEFNGTSRRRAPSHYNDPYEVFRGLELSPAKPTKLIAHTRRNPMILTPTHPHISPLLPHYQTHISDLRVGGGGLIRQIATPDRILAPRVPYQNPKILHTLSISNPPLHY